MTWKASDFACKQDLEKQLALQENKNLTGSNAANRMLLSKSFMRDLRFTNRDVC